MSNLNSLLYYLPELIIILGILLVIVFDLIPATKPYTFYLSLSAIVIAAVLLNFSYGEIHSLFMGMISIDPFSHYFKGIFLISTFSIMLVSRYENKLDDQLFLAKIYSSMAGSYARMGDANKAILLLKKGAGIIKEIEQYDALGNTYAEIAQTYNINYCYSEAVQYFKYALPLFELYNIQTDFYEASDISESYPEIVGTMKREVKGHIEYFDSKYIGGE